VTHKDKLPVNFRLGYQKNFLSRRISQNNININWLELLDEIMVDVQEMSQIIPQGCLYFQAHEFTRSLIFSPEIGSMALKEVLKKKHILFKNN
jgi:hypothetical protein